MATNMLDKIFSMGDKVTKGDPKRKADFDFYLLIIMFLAFFSVLVGNLIDFYYTGKIANLGWAFVMLAILWFQYFGLKQMYEFRKMIKSKPVQAEPLDEMIEGFKLSVDTKEIFDNELKKDLPKNKK